MNRRSHDSTIGTPIPATGPLIAAITGLGTDIRYVYVPRQVVAPRLLAGLADARRACGCAGISRPAAGPGDRRQVVHVGTGAEPLARPGEDDADHRRIALGAADGIAHLVGHRPGPRVQRLWTVQRDRGHRIVDVEEDLLVAHPPIMAHG